MTKPRSADAFSRDASREEAMTDVRWLLLLFGAAAGLRGFFSTLHGEDMGASVSLATGGVSVLAALIPLWWVRLPVLVCWTIKFGVDLAIRHNPFSALFVLVSLLHLYRVITQRGRPSRSVA